MNDRPGQRQSNAGSSIQGGSFGSFGERCSAVSRNSSTGYGSSGGGYEPLHRVSFTNVADRRIRAARNREMELMTREWLERARMTLEDEEQERRGGTRASVGWGWPWQS